MRQTPRVLTIPPTTPFLPALAAGILDGKVVLNFSPRGKLELLASATIYLPTRRAARALAEIFLHETKAPALLLPRIVPLGDVDEDALAFESGDLGPLPPAIPTGERRLVLAQLISHFAKKEAPLLTPSPAIAIALADELAHLIDDFITAGKSFADVRKAVEGERGEYDEYWERSRKFLGIVDEGWRGFLDERGLLDGAARRDKLLEQEAERLSKWKGGPVIAAGSTGTLPKVGSLLRVIARHQQGAVVLPGLDKSLEKDAYALIGADQKPMPGHPQFGLKRLIEKIGVAREAVEQLVPPQNAAREELLSLAFRPQSDDEDQSPRIAAKRSLDHLTVVEADDAREEALAIAVALREALHQNKTAALVTPDRALARRVCAELSRWNIDIDDSAGLPLADSEAGRFARLIAMAATADAAPSTLLALLHHPFLQRFFPREDVALLEIACLRGVRPAGGVAGLPPAVVALRKQAFHPSDRRSRFVQFEWDRAADCAKRLMLTLSPLIAVAEGEHRFAVLANAHLAALRQSLAGTENEDSIKLIEALEELAGFGVNAPSLSLTDYAQAFPATIREHTLRPARRENTRLRILGPLEARMISVERVVLGGMCEGVWPPETHTDSWLNRSMRKHLELDLPERRIGLSAHDFVQTTGAKEVFVTHGRKQNGVETIVSRFLQRVAAIADARAWEAAVARGKDYLDWARALEAAPRTEPLEPPRPAPPLSARPRRFSTSDMRDLTRDPYSIYARKILGLQKLNAIDEEPGASERGTLLHEILSEFARLHPGTLPQSAENDLIEIGRKAFVSMESYPAALAVWWPRFQRAAKWFVEEERKRRENTKHIFSEVSGSLELGAGNERFTITARADRIEVNKDGSIAVLDFKTGKLPTYKEAILGFEPQLLLEAAIAREGGFEGIVRGVKIAEAGPIKISGGQPPGEFKLFEPTNSKEFKAVAGPRNIAGPDHLEIAAADALANASKLLAEYTKPETAYPFAPRVQWQKDYNDYEHLARFKEWSEGGE